MNYKKNLLKKDSIKFSETYGLYVLRYFPHKNIENLKINKTIEELKIIECLVQFIILIFKIKILRLL